MPHAPAKDSFVRLAEGYDYVPVYRRLMSDVLTPVQAFDRLDQGIAACLFESVIGGEKVGRYSFLTSNPFLQIEACGTETTVSRLEEEGGKGQAGDTAQGWRTETFRVDNPLNTLRDQVGAIKVANLDELPPFVGGAVGYAGYDTVRYVEHLPNAPHDDRQLPDMFFALYDHMVVFDHVQKTITVVVLSDVREKDSAALEAAYTAACERVDRLVEQLSIAPESLDLADIDLSSESEQEFESNFSQPDFENVVRRCVEYIRAGDIFQVVVSQRLEVPFSVAPLELYRSLRVVNPSPFMFYLRSPQVTLVGSSPEILVRVVDDQITVRPLAGTRRRGADEQEDRSLAEELLADPKERAEHVMLVDLGRNDVGRVAEYGSVELSDVMVIERYSHVMHITSNVSGKLAEQYDAFDALAACLPAGTVSGAPKVRAMEIIDEMEPTRRGPYAGAVGYIDFAGNMDTCIALRTVVIQNDTAYVQVGAGIVADSVAELEYAETLSKARGLLKAIEITKQRTE